MKKFYLFLSVVSTLILFSCNDDSHGDLSSTTTDQTRIINKSGSADGVDYTLKNLSVNPNLVKITAKNATISSSASEMQNGKFSFEISSDELSEKLVPGNILYLISENNTVYFRKITQVFPNGNNYVLETTEAYIGDLFNGGSIELSVNTQEAEKALKSRNTSLIAARENYNNSFTFDIFNHIGEYKSGGFTLNPNTSISSTLNMKIGFGKSQILPNEIEVYYQINSAINPYFTFDGATNKTFSYDLSKNIPANLLDLLKKIEIDIDIPTGDFLGDIPATISIDEINIPMEVEANVAKSSHFAINTNGTFKIGFAYYNGVPGKTSHFIYENSITNAKIAEADITGEVISDMKIAIKPKIKLFDTNLLDVKGNITFGVNTFSIGNGSITQPNAFASTGNFYSSGTFSFGALGLTLYTTDLFKDNKELWNIGNFTKTMTISNFRNGKASVLPCSGLYSYSYEVTLDYKYPITGKMLSGDLEMTYDVYADNGTILETGKTIKISPKNITATSFNFSLCVPFRKINIFSIAKTSYIRNITIKDANGYIATGIINPAINSPYAQITLTR